MSTPPDALQQALADRYRIISTYARLGRRGDAVRALRRLESLADSSHVSAYSFAVVYAALGDRDRAFEFLERSYRARDEDLVPIKVDPALASLRDDPRHHDLLHRMRLES